MEAFKIPKKNEVSADNQVVFENLEKLIGFVPNIYASMAHSEKGLVGYLEFQQIKTSFEKREKQVINIIVSQVNEAAYCIAQDTLSCKLNGFTDEQISEMRNGTASFDPKLDALAKLTWALASNKGRAPKEYLETFYHVGYNYGHLVDLLIAIGDKMIMNYLCNLTDPPVDFSPIAQK
ncbi:alkylhydroperoxidase [Niastella yeongjuensis]|uniref:Alkylhydroperoxidase n=1 Tax=Niastella yeongjuensis TaxID=354355 RepID=A0A1V9E3R1_9BACT|nr:carboxymuconolactone decarboxylase family protein [Niastella yeongjuensis]OQP40742.1 alkylhydroperoxidase [Niastella yeongjuensis]SEP03012.1 alkylhydroperoxidase AhpD family core domain-containing protein [Niastella yeongjuensis]